MISIFGGLEEWGLKRGSESTRVSIYVNSILAVVIMSKRRWCCCVIRLALHRGAYMVGVLDEEYS